MAAFGRPLVRQKHARQSNPIKAPRERPPNLVKPTRQQSVCPLMSSGCSLGPSWIYWANWPLPPTPAPEFRPSQVPVSPPLDTRSLSRLSIPPLNLGEFRPLALALPHNRPRLLAPLLLPPHWDTRFLGAFSRLSAPPLHCCLKLGAFRPLAIGTSHDQIIGIFFSLPPM